MAPSPFRPALLIIDVQEDFCPPSGALAVPHGRDIVPAIRTLLSLPGFILRIATQDWHPANHISFAANHPAPNNVPFHSEIDIPNPNAPNELNRTRLWPIHCVQNTPGAQLLPELVSPSGPPHPNPHPLPLDTIIRKGTDPRLEMYSAFRDPYPTPIHDSGLESLLRAAAVTHLYLVGLAFDYCVKWSAQHAARSGAFEAVYVVADGTRPVDPAAWDATRAELEADGVRVVDLDGEEVGWVRELGAGADANAGPEKKE